MDYYINQKDKEILREVAKKQLELAKNVRNETLIKDWTKHNDLRGERPMIHLEIDTFSEEVIAPRLACVGEFARNIEWNLYRNFMNQELFDDDRVTPDYYGLDYDKNFVLFGIDIQVKHALNNEGKESLGHHFSSLINDLEEDYPKLGNSIFSVNKESTLKKKEMLEEAFGDILPIRIEGGCLYCVPTQMLVHFMSMENMMYNIYDYPDLFKAMMMRIADDTISYFRLQEQQNVLLPTTFGGSLGQGSWCYNNTLPNSKDIGPFTTRDLWGFMDSQETVGISPEMFQEFIFPAYKKIADNFGLLSYGCCEPVHPIWESCISKLDNLRKVSISPWCNEEYMGEQLRGSKVIFHRKPSPNYLGVGITLDEDALRAHIRKTLNAAKGCKLEITQRDVYTINHDIVKAKRYIDIIKEEIINNW
jgi:hypothetical protein